MEKVQELEENLDEVDISDLYAKKLIVLNDDVNTFQHVIICLITICGHTPEQAEQCAHLIHTKGKCSVKEGNSVEELYPYKDALQQNHLTCKIE